MLLHAHGQTQFLPLWFGRTAMSTCILNCNLDSGTDGKPLQMCPATASPTQFTNCWPTLLLLVRLNITSRLILRREESQQGRPRQEQKGRGGGAVQSAVLELSCGVEDSGGRTALRLEDDNNRRCLSSRI